MSKLFKKSLAFCVAIAMVFTLFAGTISVNAEDAEETLTVTLEVTNTPVEEGAPQVTFPLAVTCSGDTSINVLCLVITTTAGKVSSVVSKEATEDYTIHYNGDRALLNAGQTVEDLGGFNAAELLVTVDLNEGLDKEAYDITIDCRSENASDANENALKISYETAYILLPHTHTMSETYSYDDNGHWLACTSEFCDVVGGYTTEVAEHVWENNGDAVAPDCVDTLEQPVICNTCGATKTVNVDPVGHDYEYTNNGETHSAVCKNNAEHVIIDEAHDYVDGKCVCGAKEVTECTHAYDAADNVNYVKFTETGIVHYEICTLCGEEVALSVDDSADAAVVAGKALNQGYVSAINVDAAGTYSIPVTQNTNLQVAYVDGDKIIANSYNKNMNDNDPTNGENKIGGTTYASGSLTNVTDAVSVTVDFTGIVLAFVPKNVSKLPTATIGITQTFNLGSSIAVAFMIQNPNLENFEENYAVIRHQEYDGNTPLDIEPKYIYEYEEVELDKYGKLNRFNYKIKACQMGDKVTCVYYGVLDGIDYTVREKTDYSLVAYATGSSGYESSDAELKTLLSTIFAYGAAAQNHFGYNKNTLVTSLVSDYIEQYPARETVKKEDIEYVKSATNRNTVDFTESEIKSIIGFRKTLSLVSTIEISYQVKLDGFIKKYGEDALNDLKFVISYKKSSKTETEVEFTTVEKTIEDVAKIEIDTDGSDAGTYYWYKADDIVASMGLSESKIDVYYGDTWLADSVYSVNAYVYNQYSDGGTLGAVCRAIATYGAAAREYFKIISK